MKKNREAYVFNINHIYDLYELYAFLYSRSTCYKVGEAAGLSYAMTQLAIRNKQKRVDGRPSFDYEKEGFKVLEVMCGRGEHQRHLKLPAELLLTDYYHSDLRNNGIDPSNFIQADAVSSDFKVEFNFACALFFSASSITDPEGRHTRKNMVELYRNIHRQLPKGGGFFMDFCTDGYHKSLAVESSSTEYEESIVNPDSPLRVALGISYDSDCVVRYKKKSTYNRITGESVDRFVEPVYVMEGSRTAARVHISSPMTQRYFSETELADIAMEAGFSDLMFFKLDYTNSDLNDVIPTVLEEEDGIDCDDVDEHMANAFIAIK